MSKTHQILTDLSAGISELKKNPMAVVAQGEGAPVAILNRNKPAFYAVPSVHLRTSTEYWLNLLS